MKNNNKEVLYSVVVKTSDQKIQIWKNTSIDFKISMTQNDFRCLNHAQSMFRFVLLSIYIRSRTKRTESEITDTRIDLTNYMGKNLIASQYLNQCCIKDTPTANCGKRGVNDYIELLQYIRSSQIETKYIQI